MELEVSGQDDFSHDRQYQIQNDLLSEIDAPPPEFRGIQHKVDNILEKMAMDVLKVKQWLDSGAKIDDNIDRIVDEFSQAKKKFNNLVIQVSSLEDMLKQLTEHQAWILWIFRGAKPNNDIETMKKDYYDAKRHIGYLYANVFIEKCINDELGSNCLDYLKKEYIPYLVTLSLEDYIRIKAYYQWGKMGKVVDDNMSRIKSDYFTSIQEIHSALWNCKQRDSKEFIETCCNICVISEHISRVTAGEVKIAKKNVGKRLQYDISVDTDKFVNELYTRFDEIFNELADPNRIIDLLEIIYKNTHVPNMLEFILRCFFCTFITSEQHNEIRKKYNICEASLSSRNQQVIPTNYLL